MAQVVQGYGYGHEKVDFGGQKVKGQGHTRPKIDLVAWRRHRSQSQPLVSSIFSSYYIVSRFLWQQLLEQRCWCLAVRA